MLNPLHHVQADLLAVVENSDQMPDVLLTRATWIVF